MKDKSDKYVYCIFYVADNGTKNGFMEMICEYPIDSWERVLGVHEEMEKTHKNITITGWQILSKPKETK